MNKALCLLLSLGVFQASAATLDCDVTYNSEGPFDLSIDLAADSNNKLVGEIAEYKIYASRKDDLFELQTLDLGLSLRSYSSANVAIGEKIEISQWKRESLFEIKCKRIK